MTRCYVTGGSAYGVDLALYAWHSQSRITVLVCADDAAGLAALDYAPTLRPAVATETVGAPWAGWDGVEGSSIADVLRCRDEHAGCERVLVSVEAQRAEWAARRVEVRVAERVARAAEEAARAAAGGAR